MGKDLISRQAAIEVADAILSVTGDKNVAKVWNQLKDLPSAQPEITLESAIDYLHNIGWMKEHDRIMAESAPVVHAHWESAEFDDELKTCSNCHCDKDNNGTTWYYIRPEWRYCPLCGAIMDERATE